VNGNLRYQLTAVGSPMPGLHIAEELSDNRFKVASGAPGAKVCWQVTGVQQDRWAEANPIRVEEEKPAEEQGYYLHPELYGEPEELGIGRTRRQERLRQMETLAQRRRRPSPAESPPGESTERAHRAEQEPGV
jgi:hypothetical protein